MVISHTGIKTTQDKIVDLVAWYEAALAPLGYKKTYVILDGLVNGFSDECGKADWWVSVAQEGTPVPSHHAFAAKDRATVEAFHKAGMEAGGKDNGAPGLRPQYHENYYAAFVFDPAGNNIEVMHFGSS